MQCNMQTYSYGLLQAGDVFMIIPKSWNPAELALRLVMCCLNVRETWSRCHGINIGTTQVTLLSFCSSISFTKFSAEEFLGRMVSRLSDLYYTSFLWLSPSSQSNLLCPQLPLSLGCVVENDVPCPHLAIFPLSWLLLSPCSTPDFFSKM